MNKFLSVLILLFSANVFASYEFSDKAGKVNFNAKGWPSLLKIKGTGVGVSGKLVEKESKISGDIVFDLTSLKTGIELRDKHMKDKYLEVVKFPKATLKIVDQKVPEKLSGKVKFNGILELHGVTKKITGVAKLKNKKGKITLKADFKIKLSDFKIAIPSFQGITVAEEVKVELDSIVKDI